MERCRVEQSTVRLNRPATRLLASAVESVCAVRDTALALKGTPIEARWDTKFQLTDKHPKT